MSDELKAVWAADAAKTSYAKATKTAADAAYAAANDVYVAAEAAVRDAVDAKAAKAKAKAKAH